MYTPALPPPMKPIEFYLLLALARGDSYSYELKAIIYNDSKGSLDVDRSNLRQTIRKLESEALIEPTGPQPAGKSGTLRKHYAITKHGLLRLKEEFIRLTHAIAIGDHAHLTPDPQSQELPLDIQRLRLDATH